MVGPPRTDDPPAGTHGDGTGPRRRVDTAPPHADTAPLGDVELYRRLLDAAPDAVVLVDEDGRVVHANRQVGRLFGYASGELLGQPVEILLPAADRVRHPQLRAAYAAAPRTREMGSGRVQRAQRRDGTEFAVEVSLSALPTPDGLLVAGAVRDITQRRAEQVALTQAKELAEATSRELETFSYSVAHDLRAPLRAVHGFAQLLVEDHASELSAEALALVHRVQASAQHMDQLVDGLLALSRVTRADLVRADVDLTALVRQALGRLRESEPERRVESVVDDGLHCSGDRRLLALVVENLLSNAWKFTRPAADPRIEVRGSTDPTGATVVTVRDNGVGFDPRYASRLFDPFQRLHPSSEFPGSGVGLATAQRVVLRHGGRIWAEGEVGVGAAVSFTIEPEDGRPT